MVNRGKPSAACGVCRQKRRKCDLRRPACGQCIRASVVCPGYRDLSKLVIRNETKEVIRKAEAAKTKKLASTFYSQEVSGPCHIGASDGCLDELDFSALFSFVSSAVPSVVPSHILPSIYDVAVAHFVLAFAPAGQFQYLPELVAPDILDAAAAARSPTRAQDELASPLPHAILACSLATLSLTPEYSSPDVLALGYKIYNAAITSLNAAFSVTATTVLDSTLLSVLLLGLFEALLFRGRKSPKLWTAHTRGALALLKLRGAEQFSTELGRKMFIHAANNIRASCAQMDLPSPRELMEMQDQAIAMKWLDPTKYIGVRSGLVMEKMTRMMTEVTGLGGFSSTSSRGVVIEVLDIDDEITAIISDLMGHRHRRAGPPLARSLIVLHTLRLIFARFVHRSFTESPRCSCGGEASGIDADDTEGTDDTDSHAGCITEAQEIMALHLTASHVNDAATEILSNVPCFMGVPPSQAYLRRYLIWPLSVLAGSPFVVQSARALAFDYLHKIGRHFGLGQAMEAARMAESGPRMEDWIVVQILS